MTVTHVLAAALVTVVRNPACRLACVDNTSIMDALRLYAETFGLEFTSLVEDWS